MIASATSRYTSEFTQERNRTHATRVASAFLRGVTFALIKGLTKRLSHRTQFNSVDFEEKLEISKWLLDLDLLTNSVCFLIFLEK